MNDLKPRFESLRLKFFQLWVVYVPSNHRDEIKVRHLTHGPLVSIRAIFPFLSRQGVFVVKSPMFGRHHFGLISHQATFVPPTHQKINATAFVYPWYFPCNKSRKLPMEWRCLSPPAMYNRGCQFCQGGEGRLECGSFSAFGPRLIE